MLRRTSLDTVDLSRPILRVFSLTPAPLPVQAHDLLALLDAKMPVAAHGRRLRSPLPQATSQRDRRPSRPTGRCAWSENSRVGARLAGERLGTEVWEIENTGGER